MTEPAWTDLGGGLRVRQSRVYWMNSVLLADREHTLLVDPGVLPSELDDLAASARDAADLTLIFTHGDWDHVLGKPWWPAAMTVAHDCFAAEVRERRSDIQREAVEAATRAGESWTRGFEPFRPDQAVSGLHFTRFGPWRLVFRDAPGHSASMLSIHLPERRTLLAADMLSDIEIPMIDHSWAAYRKTLAELLPLAEHGAIETLVPGHGGIAHDRAEVVARIEEDLAYLDRLEDAVEEARRRGLALEDVQDELAAMEYRGKHADYSMADTHRRNIERVYREQPRTAAAPRRSSPRRGASTNGARSRPPES